MSVAYSTRLLHLQNKTLERAEQLHNANAFLEAIVENIPDMVFVKDAKELRFVRFNKAGEILLGLARGDLYGKNDYDFFPADEADAFTAKDREVLDAGKLHDIPEEPIHTASQGTRYLHTKKVPILDETGEPKFLLGISEDITDAKAAKERLALIQSELESSEGRSRLLLSCLPGAIWTTDAEGRLTSVAGSLVQRMGLDDVAAIGQPIDELLGELADPAEVDAAHKGTEPTFEFALGDSTVEVVTEAMSDGTVVAAALDVTERRRREVQRFNERLQQAQKLELLGILAGGIAHDFNNLLSGILGFNSLAMSRLPADSPARVDLEHVDSAAERAAELTRQMLAYSGRGRFVVERVDLSHVTRELASLLKVSISKKVLLRMDFAVDPVFVEADVAQLRQVIMNLITNASDAIGDENGTVTVCTGLIEADREYLDRTYIQDELPEGTYATLEVTDTGSGMSTDVIERMFDPFFTTKTSGHGLGLAATLGIVRGHKGAISVYSEPAVGTTVKCLFPVAAGAPTIGPELSPAPPRTGSGVILAVDDEPMVLALARATLEWAGYEVLTAEDGQVAVEIFEKQHKNIDVVLLDMTMPRLNGEEAFRKMRAIQPGVRVLLSSGYNEQEATSRFAGKGLAGFIQKPYRTKDLLAQLEALLKGR